MTTDAKFAGLAREVAERSNSAAVAITTKAKVLADNAVDIPYDDDRAMSIFYRTIKVIENRREMVDSKCCSHHTNSNFSLSCTGR